MSDWRAERDEYEAGRLLDVAEELEWKAHRNDVCGLVERTVEHGAMVYRWGADRAAVEAEWPEGREWRRLRWVAALAVERQEAREAEAAA